MRLRIISLLVSYSLSTHISADTLLTNDTYEIDPISITSERLQTAGLVSAMTLHQLNQEQLKTINPRNLPEALINIPGVHIQKTANGQGSPFIRGFTGYRTLAMIDGVRYNNSVYRDGPNEYFSLIDSNSIENIELFSGPASAVYGSDAIGGTLNITTKSADLFSHPEGEFFSHGNQQFRYASAENSFISRSELELGQGQKWGVKAGYSHKNFGDVDAADLGELDKTGYDESAFDIRFDYVLNAQWDLTMVHQQLTQNDVWRTHSTIFSESFAGTEVGTDLRRLKDQQRQLNYLKLRGYEINNVIDHATVTLSHQQWQEDGDRIRSSGKRIDDFFDSNMYGIDLQLESHFKEINLTYGFDYYQDNVDSGRIDFNADGSIDEVRIQGPIGDDARFNILGAYIQAQFDATEHLKVNLSSRYSYVDADIGRYEDPTSNQAASFKNNWDNVSSAIRVSYALDDKRQKSIWSGISQSFRAPNIADLTRFGGSRSTETEVAATQLDPEKFLTYEIGFNYKNLQHTFQFNSTYYYTDIQNFIASTPTGNIVDGLIEVSKQNSAHGHIHGIELDMQYMWNNNWSANANITWLEGQLTRADTTSDSTEITEHFSRIMPLTAHAGIKWQSNNKDSWVGANVTFVAKQDKLSEGDKQDTQRIPPGGTPSYQLLNIYSGWKLNPHTTVTLSLNNVFDEAYRSHGSGSNEPGRSLLLGSSFSF
jgi:hemoglobin/transferrin/lactoferrin receptor protein